MKYTLQIKDFEMTAQDFATILYDVLCIRENNLIVECPDEFDGLCTGSCYEDQIAAVLWNGGYLWVYDTEQYMEDKENVTNCSEVLDIDHLYYNDDYDCFCPVYKLTRERVEEAMKQIITKCSPQAIEVYDSLKEILDDENGNPDFWDNYNVLQFIVFGEVVYC